jgi:hypothetical protein
MTDLTTISLGAGVQSSTLVEEAELPPPDVVIFADTGDEPQYVYQQVDYLRGRLQLVDVPLVTVQKSNMVDDIYGGKSFAALPLFTVLEERFEAFGKIDIRQRIGRLKRQCTHEYKIEAIEKYIREMLFERGMAKQQEYQNRIYVNKGVQVESWLGITLDEAERMKPCRTKWITHRWPLIDMRLTRQDCINWLNERGLPVPGKSSCIRCPYHNDAHFAEMKVSRPGDWQKVVQFDDDLRSGKLRLSATAAGKVYLHRSCIPLSQVDLSPDNGQMSFEFCDEGYCWT